jgi:hypothetical protein
MALHYENGENMNHPSGILKTHTPIRRYEQNSHKQEENVSMDSAEKNTCRLFFGICLGKRP